MNCSNCGAENKAGRRFCVQCASPLGTSCPNCGVACDPEDRFCGNCATPLRADAAADGTARIGSDGRSASTTGSPGSTVAERRIVSVLFADLVGFTPFAEERDPEAVRDMLSTYFDLARDAVERHGGTIEKFIGDAVMAVWGTPIAREDDAERAVRAGLELVDAVHGLGTGIEARAGVLTGDAAVSLGAVGQGMVAGDLVNTAARLQAVALPGTVLVGEATYRAASASIAFEPAGEQLLKGKAAPLQAWLAIRVVAERGGRGRNEGLEPPFVGRDEELRLIKDLLHTTGRERRTRLVSITGPAGIGKSRLTWELEKYVDGVVENVFWHRGRSPSYGEGITFWALGEMVRRRAGLAENEDEATTRTRIAATVAEYVTDESDRGWVEPALLTLLGLEPPPPGGRDVLFAGWRIFFEHVARRGTAVLLFEDLQWADSGLLDFIEHVVEWSKGVPLFVVTLARPELIDRRPDWGTGIRQFSAIALEPLSDPHMRELLAGLVPDLPETAVTAILRRADGVPLYAVEIVRSLIADGQLQRVGDAYRPGGDLTSLTVPETLRSLIASRLDALDPVDRTLLQDASVLGQAFTMTALGAINGLPEQELETRLRGLVRREVVELEIDPRSPERGQYTFVQSLIREVAYGTLGRRERRARHLAVARHYEAVGDEEKAGALASHYLAAYEASAQGEEANAVGVQARLALRAAADRAASLGAHDQAVAFIEQAIAVTAEPTERAELLGLAAGSADALARYEEADTYAAAAIQLNDQAGNALASARLGALRGHILIDAARIVDAISFLDALLAGVEALGDGDDVRDVEAEILAQLSRALMRNGDSDRAVTIADRALAWAERRNLVAIVADAFNNKGSALSDLGRRREAVAIAEVAVRLADAGGWIERALRARNNLASIVADDDPMRTLVIVREGLELALRVGNRTNLIWLTGTAGFSTYFLGQDWDRALSDVDQAMESTQSPNDRARLLMVAAMIRTSRGEDVSSSLSEADRLLQAFNDPTAVASLAWNRGEVALLAGRLEDAFDQFMRAYEAFPAWVAITAGAAFRAALWLRDRARAEQPYTFLRDQRSTGTTSVAALVAAEAGRAALDGRTSDALAGYREAISRQREMQQEYELARAILDATIALPGDPEVGSWASEARAIFERLHAAPSLQRLEAALADAGRPRRPGAAGRVGSGDLEHRAEPAGSSA